jgi:hypothetical protein
MSKIMIEEATVKLALEALVYASSYCDTYDAIDAVKQALAAQPAPVQKAMPENWFAGMPEEYRKEAWRVATPPAQPAVPDAIHHTDMSESLEYIQGWNDCRAAMLEMMK